MTVKGIDYAWQHPDPAAIAKAGYVFACRYLSRDPSKNLTLAEAQALAAHGIWCVCNWEYGAQDMLRGYAGGIADAQLAAAQAKAAGMPPGRPIYFSADWDVAPAQEATVLAYLSGAATVLGAGATGEYGGYYPVKTARDHGTVWTWQSAAWSGAQWDARDTVRQTGFASVGGVQVDVNEAQVADYGQWMPGRLPATLMAAPAAASDTVRTIRPTRGNDMHADLKLNTPVVFTNPAAVLGDSSYLLLASDFGDATVRVAQYSLKAGGWVIENHAVNSTSGATKIAMTGDVNKVSVKQTAGTGTVGIDVLA